MIKLYKYKCNNCQKETFPSIEKSKRCDFDENCPQKSLKKIQVNADDYLFWIDSELESANYHSQYGLALAIYNNIIGNLKFTPEEEIELARAIADGIYKKI